MNEKAHNHEIRPKGDYRLAARQIGLSLLIGLASFGLSIGWQKLSGTSDLYQRICAARELAAGNDPYKSCDFWDYRGQPAAEYPLTTLLALVPLSSLAYIQGAALFWAISNTLLAFGLLRKGQPHQWLIFLSGQYWIAFAWGQFSVLITAVVLLPSLLPLALLKPQIGLPVILTNLTWRRAAACAAFLLLTFLIFPLWPLSWWGRSSLYDGVIPLLALPLGPLMALALLRWRERDAWFLFLYACVPQRFIYDLTPLFLLPGTLRRMLLLCILSWFPTIAWMTRLSLWPETDVHLALIFTYLPLLGMVLLRNPRMGLAEQQKAPQGASWITDI
jgi:hypothetical protein